MGNSYIIYTILIISAVTFCIRAVPFVLFDNGKVPPVMLYLGKATPAAIMAMLVVYCLKDASFWQWPFALPEILASAAVFVLYKLKRNNLLAITGGTALYMVLVQVVFV